MKINQLVLGSTSSFRAQILRQTGIVNFKQIASHADEESVQGKDARSTAEARSLSKGLGVLVDEPSLVLSGDQVLEFEGNSYGKASSAQEAVQRLELFSGKSHQLHSAYSLLFASPGEESRPLKSGVVSVSMHMAQLSKPSIEAYVRTNEWQGCAGCYQFENRGAQLFSKVDGDSFTVIGLPMTQIFTHLRQLGINLLRQPEGPWNIHV